MLRKEIKKEIEDVILKAGEILLSFFGNNILKTDKPDRGFVTEADLASENFLIVSLRQIFPQATIFAEESGNSENGAGESSDYCFVIDPLDGTTNFAHNIPYFCISVALTYKNEPILAFVYNPITGQMFSAQKGKGAFLNDKPIKISILSDFKDSFIALCVPYKRTDEYYKRFINGLDQVMRDSFAFRHCGAAALDLAHVACGAFDGVFFEDMFWWDFAAGLLLIQEAGGRVSDFKNNLVEAKTRTFIAGNSDIHAKLLAIFKPF